MSFSLLLTCPFALLKGVLPDLEVAVPRGDAAAAVDSEEAAVPQEAAGADSVEVAAVTVAAEAEAEADSVEVAAAEAADPNLAAGLTPAMRMIITSTTTEVWITTWTTAETAGISLDLAVAALSAATAVGSVEEEAEAVEVEEETTMVVMIA